MSTRKQDLLVSESFEEQLCVCVGGGRWVQVKYMGVSTNIPKPYFGFDVARESIL